MTSARAPLRLGLGALGAALLAAAPLGALAKESLGVFGDWGAFRDAGAGRCYAIAMPIDPSDDMAAKRDYQPYATIASWPARSVRNQLHIRLSRKIAPKAAITLRVGNRRFALTGGGGDAWARDKAMDAAIIAAIRSASTMQVSARDARGRRFTDRYRLQGAASAIDAALVACSPRRSR